MTLEQLRIFVAVAELEHVTKAAAALHLTQSATSAAIAALEARYSARLFDRIGRRIKLTDAGRLFLTEARAVLARAAAAETILADVAGLKKGRLPLAASQTVASYWLPPLMYRFRARYPGVAVTLEIANTESVAEKVREGFVDVGVVEGEIDDPALDVATVAEDEMVLVVGPSHPWRDGRKVVGRDLAETDWALRETGSGTRAILEAAVSEAGLSVRDLNVVMELASNEAVRSAVEAGAGATVLSRLVAGPSLSSGALVEVAFALPKRRFLAVRLKERYATRAATAFLEMLAHAPGRPAPLDPDR